MLETNCTNKQTNKQTNKLILRHARPSRPADDDDRARAGRCSASRRRTVGPSPRRPPCWLRWPLARAIAQLPGPHAATAQCLDLWPELAACRWRGAARRARGGLNGACWARRERWPAAGTSDATTACTGSTARPVCGLHDRFCDSLTMGASVHATASPACCVGLRALRGLRGIASARESYARAGCLRQPALAPLSRARCDAARTAARAAPHSARAASPARPPAYPPCIPRSWYLLGPARGCSPYLLCPSSPARRSTARAAALSTRTPARARRGRC